MISRVYDSCALHFLTHTRPQVLDSSKLKEFADDDFKFDENGRKLSKQVENTMGKGEIACYEQCFQKACFPGASKGVIVWEWVNNEFYKCIKFRVDSFYSLEVMVREKNKRAMMALDRSPEFLRLP